MCVFFFYFVFVLVLVPFTNDKGNVAFVRFSVNVVFGTIIAEIFGALEALDVCDGVKMVVVHKTEVDTRSLVRIGVGKKILAKSVVDQHQANAKNFFKRLHIV